jgi:hypothetical protein
MPKFARGRSSRVAAVFILPAVMLVSAGQAQPSPHPHAQKRMVRAVDRTVQEGLDAQLPPHISTLLRISEEKECLVKQAVVRTENVVQGFDVSTANRNDVVIFVVDETTNDQTLYLTSPEGTLRRVVKVKSGEGAERRITDQEKKAFEKEKQFWLDRLAPVPAPK